MKKIIIIILIVVGFGGLWFLSRYWGGGQSSDSEIISRNGLHWHSELSIKILGEFQEIPTNIGIGITHQPIHTHTSDGILHSEFSGLVTKKDITLGHFFKIWGKTFNKDCILDKCSGQEGQLKMLVDGKENSDYDNYVMEDGDKIEIIFE